MPYVKLCKLFIAIYCKLSTENRKENRALHHQVQNFIPTHIYECHASKQSLALAVLPPISSYKVHTPI